MGIDAQMFVKIRNQRLTQDEVKRLAWELGEAFGPQRFWIIKPTEWRSDFRGALTIIEEYSQDGDTIYPAVGEQFIECHLGTRYYGEGYERGDLPLIISVAQWLEIKIPGCEVWYGGDSSGVSATAFDAVERARLFRYFVECGHRPYHGYFSDNLGSRAAHLCQYCDQPMTQYGFGGDYQSWHCDGCGEKKETRDGGETWTWNPKEAA